MRFKCSFTPLFTANVRFRSAYQKSSLMSENDTRREAPAFKVAERESLIDLQIIDASEKTTFNFPNQPQFSFFTFSRLFFFAPLCNCFRSLCFLLLWFTDNSNETSCIAIIFFPSRFGKTRTL